MLHRMPEGLPLILMALIALPAWMSAIDFGAMYQVAGTLGILTTTALAIVKHMQTQDLKRDIAALRAELQIARENRDAQLNEIDTRLRGIESEANK